MYPAYETCHHCECPRIDHRNKIDPLAGVLLLGCHGCQQCTTFAHHPDWEPIRKDTWVDIIGYDGQPYPNPSGGVQRALIASYDPAQDSYWIRRPFAVLGGAVMRPTGAIGYAHFYVPSYTVAPA